MKALPLSIALATLLIAPTAMADITAKDVKKVMNEHRGEVLGCYTKHAQKQKSAKGKVTLDISLKTSGEVSKVSIAAPGVKGKKFFRCVVNKVNQWQFPENSGVTITVPYHFQHTRPSS
jgi:hypothetical protein